MRWRRSLLALSDRAVKALQKIDRGRGQPVRISYKVEEIRDLVNSWKSDRDSSEWFTLNRKGRDALRDIRKPKPYVDKSRI